VASVAEQEDTSAGAVGAPRSIVNGLNDRGQIAGVDENPDAAPGPRAAAMRLRGTA
jgi:hypothetical protein